MTALNDVYRAGAAAAFAHYGVKTAAIAGRGFVEGLGDWFRPSAWKMWAGRIPHELGAQASNVATREVGNAAFMPGGVLEPLDTARKMIVGQPELLRHGRNLVKPGGPLHYSNLFWPKGDPLGKLMMGALPAYGLYKTVKGDWGDPNEGRLSNILGHVGSTIAGAYAWPLSGMLGSGIAADLGGRVGRGAGHLLGSHPTGPTPQQIAQMQRMYNAPPSQYPSSSETYNSPVYPGGY